MRLERLISRLLGKAMQAGLERRADTGAATPDDRKQANQARQARQTTKQVRQMMRLGRRFGRF